MTVDEEGYYACSKCGLQDYDLNDNQNYYSSWNAFGRLKEHMQKSNDWFAFRVHLLKVIHNGNTYINHSRWEEVVPPTFAEAVGKFYGWREDAS